MNIAGVTKWNEWLLLLSIQSYQDVFGAVTGHMIAFNAFMMAEYREHLLRSHRLDPKLSKEITALIASTDRRERLALARSSLASVVARSELDNDHVINFHTYRMRDRGPD